jgi:hypothetical protein
MRRLADASRVSTALRPPTKKIVAGVVFPVAQLHGAVLAKDVVTLGLIDGTYDEGFMLDHVVSSKVHMAVMDDIDAKFGPLPTRTTT